MMSTAFKSSLLFSDLPFPRLIERVLGRSMRLEIGQASTAGIELGAYIRELTTTRRCVVGHLTIFIILIPKALIL